jgi:hypothetical protein
MIQVNELCCKPSELQYALRKQSLVAARRLFSRASGWAAAVHALSGHFPEDTPQPPWEGQGGIRDSAHELRNIVIDLFLTPHLPIGNGDRDRTGVVPGSGTFTDERSSQVSNDIWICQEQIAWFLINISQM